MTRMQNTRALAVAAPAPDRLTSILGLVVGLLTALAANLMLH